MLRPATTAVLGLAALLAGCRSAPAPAAEAAAAAQERALQEAVDARLRQLFPEVSGAPTREAIRQALYAQALVAQGEEEQLIAWLRAGEYEQANELLARRLAEREWSRARELASKGDERGALALYDQALERLPRESALRLERAEASQRLAATDGDALLYDSALGEFEAVLVSGASARAALGAARCARALGRTERGVAHARLAVAEARRDAGASGELLRDCRRVAADLLFVAQDEAAAAGQGAAALMAAEEGLLLLQESLAADPSDAWGWRTLARRLQGLSRTRDALAAARSGIGALGPDEELLAVLAATAREQGGRELLVDELGRIAAELPTWRGIDFELGRAAYEEGLEQCDLAREREAARELAAAAFARAESRFAAAADDAQRRETCTAFRAVARSAQGWLALQGGAVESARDRFFSVQDLGLAALRVEAPPLVASAVAGLHACGAAFAQRAQDPLAPEALDALESAARIYAFLHESEPQVVDWANNAGFFQRDLAVALEIRARELAARDGRPEAADLVLARARETMEASLRCYAAAAELAPDDVRIVNDTGLVLTYYLQRDVPRARQLLSRAVEHGEAQVRALQAAAEEAGLADDERAARARRLEEVATALGDAYQNLGVLALTLEGDARAAKPWFERSLATGADPREEVRGKGGFLERCEAAIASGADPRLRPEQRWAAPYAARPAQTGPSKAAAPKKKT